MYEKRFIDYLLIIMINLNLFIVMYIALIMSHSLSGSIWENSALEFLTEIPIVSIAAWKIPVMVILLYVCFLLVMHIQNVGILGLFLKVCFEIGISFYISFILSFSYTGIILLILVDTMKYFPKSKWRFPFAVMICLVYLLVNYKFLSIYFEMIPLEAYLSYYQSEVRPIIQAIKNMSSSLNLFIAFVYMILLLRVQTSEKEKILMLNQMMNKTNKELQQANIRLEEYAKEAEKMVKTKERNRLAREIHDTLGHALTGIITGIEACIALMDISPETVKIQLKAIAEVARQGITDVRRSVEALRPDALEKFNLQEALTSTVEEMRGATGAKIEYKCTTSLNCFSDDEEEIIYRIVQESITNSIRHGHATHIQIDINREYNILIIQIRDNGMGCKNIKKGFGLHHMEERVHMLQGNLFYNGDDGFFIEAQIPLRWGTEEQTND